jgi:hypothetical protein
VANSGMIYPNLIHILFYRYYSSGFFVLGKSRNIHEDLEQKSVSQQVVTQDDDFSDEEF